MKHLILSFALATLVIALPGAIFFASRNGTREISDSQRALEERVRSLDERLGRVVEKLEGLERNKAPFIHAPALSQEAAAPPGEPAEEEEAAPGSGDAREEQKLIAAVLRGEDPSGGGLRDWVKQVIEDDRQERHRGEMRRMEEQQKEMQALLEGPYGQFNYRVNSLARTLGLDESQKARYFALLSEYASRFEEARKNVNREDAAEYKAYQDRKKAQHDEFEALVLQNLTLAQAEIYQNLPDFEKTPDPKHMAGGDNFVVSLGEGGGEGVVFFEKTIAPTPVKTAPMPVPAPVAK
jgi:hypothetical protein